MASIEKRKDFQPPSCLFSGVKYAVVCSSIGMAAMGMTAAAALSVGIRPQLLIPYSANILKKTAKVAAVAGAVGYLDCWKFYGKW